MSALEKVKIEHLNGVSWIRALKPRRWHRCKPQTRGATGTINLIERCACGAIRLDGRYWFERNSRSR